MLLFIALIHNDNPVSPKTPGLKLLIQGKMLQNELFMTGQDLEPHMGKPWLWCEIIHANKYNVPDDCTVWALLCLILHIVLNAFWDYQTNVLYYIFHKSWDKLNMWKLFFNRQERLGALILRVCVLFINNRQLFVLSL